jgi:DNA adenine methylase
MSLKYHGGKSYLARKIVARMPEHLHYVEPYFGGGAVLLAKPHEGVSEVVNDIDRDLMNFWLVLQGQDDFRSFVRLCQATPFSEAVWQSADLEFAEWPEPDEQASSRVVRAWKYFVHVRQSLAGRRKTFATLSRSRTRRGMNEQASAWLSAVDGLAEVHERLRRVVILCRDALDVIRQQDGRNTLFYLDPPYVAEARSCPDVYRHEMTHEDHVRMLDVVLACRGKVMLSGYDNSLYRDRLAGWQKEEFVVPNHASGEAVKPRMVECLWMNF